LQAILNLTQERLDLLKIQLWQRRQCLFVDVLIPPPLSLIQQRLQAGQGLGLGGLSHHHSREGQKDREQDGSRNAFHNRYP